MTLNDIICKLFLQFIYETNYLFIHKSKFFEWHEKPFENKD